MSDSKQLIEWDRPRGASAMSKTSLRDYLLAHSATIENAMGETARRLMKVTDIVDSIVAASLVDTKLLECSPVSLIYAAVLAARTGLRIGEPYREAYVSVSFNSDLKMPWAMFRPMAAGLKAIAFRSGKVAMIEWGAVRAADEFSFRLGDDSFISHSPARRTAPSEQASADERRVWAERTRLTEAYAIIHFLSGHRQFVVLDREQVWRHRKRSKRHDLPNSPWNTDEPAMWEKSAFIELFKRLEFDTEMAAAVAALNDEEAGTARLAPALLPEVEVPLPVSPYTDEARPQHDPEADVRSRVAARAARAKKKAAAADPNGDAPQSVSQAAPDSQAAHATAIRERMELRGIRDDEATVLLSWLGVAAVADIAAAGLQRALAVTDLKWLVRETGADIRAACQYFGAGEVAELTDAQVSACIRKLEREREVA